MNERVTTNMVNWDRISSILQAAARGGRQRDLEELLDDTRFSNSRIRYVPDLIIHYEPLVDVF